MQAVVVVDAAAAGNGKDGSTTRSQPSSTRATLPPKLLLPLLVVAVVVAAAVLLLGDGVASPTPLPLTTAKQAAAATGLERWRLAPASAWHNMSNEELLWAASWRPSVRRYPYRRVPKVAFMFLTRGPLPLAPLWERFFDGGNRGHYSVYVHTTPGYQPDFRPASVFYRRQVPSQVLCLLPSFSISVPCTAWRVSSGWQR
jgi:hypothetical protein